MSKNQTQAAGPFHTGHCLSVIKIREKYTKVEKRPFRRDGQVKTRGKKIKRKVQETQLKYVTKNRQVSV